MNLSAWLTYLETLHPKSIDMGLERISRVAQTLDILPWQCPTITITGTNGKGSCAAILESVLLAAGYRIGTYTSPHLLHYNERIKIQGTPVSDVALCQVFEQVESARGDISLTYFEFGTLAALLLFQQANLDRVILEVGLGGRLDAVNIIDADIAIITTIALDHQEWLGNDRESIGYEKAGIARANKPVICGDWDIPHSIHVYTRELNAPLYCQGIDFGYTYDDNNWSWWGNSQHLMDLPRSSLELQNMATAFKALEILAADTSIPRSAMEQGLQQVYLPGRFECIEKKGVMHILDVAHNPAAAACFTHRLSQLNCSGRTLAVVGMLSDKDHKSIFTALRTHIHSWYLGTLEGARGSSAEKLAQNLYSVGVNAIFCHLDIVSAYRAAIAAAEPGDRIVVFGSHHTVAAILKE